jgi:Zn-dependent membrane protease YugP
MFFYLDPLYLLVFIVTLAISLAAQFFVTSTYRKYSRIRNSTGLTGLQVGEQIVRRTRLGDQRDLAIQAPPTTQSLQVEGIRFAAAPGRLTDHYDPRQHTVFLSQDVASQPSVAAMAIVAHELGHAEQRETGSLLMSVRNVLVPAIRFSPTVAYVCIMLGLIFNLLQLFWLGVLFYAAMVVFVVLDLPVEIDASRRAMLLLNDAGLVYAEADAGGVRRVLTAAASTYVAAAVVAILQLLYYISIGRRRG